ncbi:methyltransferase [Aureococcus anophagefferens]|uniref:Methyltransferase n=1 Tax=Aureococcus anophagefferens TaxID=44056 RepID=A0ABR1FJ26_AURAN
MADGQINDGSSVQYGKTQYWDERYTEDPAQFDWRGGRACAVPDGRLVDISLVVVKQMLETYKDSGLKGLKFIHGNACSLEFPDESFDGAIAKATMDVLMCGEGSTSNVYAMCHEVSRVLRPGGVFFVVSHDPGYLQYLDPEQANREFGWKVTMDQIPKPVMNPKNPAVDEKGRPLYHYVYICKKKLSEHGAS